MAVDDAFESAARLLRHRDRATADLDRRLAGRGFDREDRAGAIDRLTRTGVLDDARFAASRAQSLAARGAGDRLIRHDLVAAGVGSDVIDAALGELDSESDRASRIVERRGTSPKTARYLAARGFGEDTLRTAVAPPDDDALG